METIKKVLLAIWQYVKAFFKSYPEFLSIPAAVIVWVISIPALRLADPTSGVFDAGVFQVPIFSVLQLFIYISMAWLLLRLVFGTQFRFIKYTFKETFETLTPWQKTIIAYGTYFVLVLCLVALSFTLR